MLSRQLIVQRLRKVAQNAELLGSRTDTSKADRVWCARVIAELALLCKAGDVDECGRARVASRGAEPGRLSPAAPVSGDDRVITVEHCN